MLEKLDVFEQKIPRQHHSLGTIQLALEFVLNASNHLRTSVRNMAVMAQWIPSINIDVCWYSVRCWVMRIGYYELTRKKEIANDWIWIIDHSIQLSSEKALVIVGFRLNDFKDNRRALKLRDVCLICLDVVIKSNGTIVNQQLQDAVKKTGVPRAIIHDNGSELKLGVRLFQKQHGDTASIYDIKHKVAIEIKHSLENDSQWEAFTKSASQINQRLKQTSYAYLCPPKLRNKARYMNLDKRVAWGQRLLKKLDEEKSKNKQEIESHIGVLENYRADIQRWSELLAITACAENFSRKQWLSKECEVVLQQQLDDKILVKDKNNQKIQKDLVNFIKEQSSSCNENEYLPNSSEVLESLFGRQKYLEGEQQSKSGFSGLLLGIGAIVTDISSETISTALETVAVKQVIDWKNDFLGKTLQAKKMDLALGDSLIQSIARIQEESLKVVMDLPKNSSVYKIPNITRNGIMETIF